MSVTAPASLCDFEHYRLVRSRDGKLAEFSPVNKVGHRKFLALDVLAFRLVFINIYREAAIPPYAEQRLEKLASAIKSSDSPAFCPLLRWGHDDGDFYVMSAVADGETLGSYLAHSGPVPPGIAASLVVEFIRSVESEKLVELIGGFSPANLLISEGRLIFDDYLRLPKASLTMAVSLEWLFDGLVSGRFASRPDGVSPVGSIAEIRGELEKIATQFSASELSKYQKPVRQWFLEGAPLEERHFEMGSPWEIGIDTSKGIKAEGNCFTLSPSDSMLPAALSLEQHRRGINYQAPALVGAVPPVSTSRCGHARLIGQQFPNGEWRTLSEMISAGEVSTLEEATQVLRTIVEAVDRLETSGLPLWWLSAKSVYFFDTNRAPLIRPFLSLEMLMEGLPVPRPIVNRIRKLGKERDAKSARAYRRSSVTLGLINEIPAFSNAMNPSDDRLSEFLQKFRQSPESFPVMEDGTLLEQVIALQSVVTDEAEPVEEKIAKPVEAIEPRETIRFTHKAAVVIGICLVTIGSVGAAIWRLNDRSGDLEEVVAEIPPSTGVPVPDENVGENVDFSEIELVETRPQSLEYLYAAADAGDAEAMTFLGRCFLSGWGVSADPEQAEKWFSQAVEAGDAAAHYELGVIFARNGQRDVAFETFTKGAALDDLHCTLVIARMHESGFGTPVDPDEARIWYQKAASLSEATVEQ